MIEKTFNIKGLNPELSSLLNKNSSDPDTIAKKVETIFLSELLKVMMAQTSFGKNKTISTFMPVIVSGMAEAMSERGIGVGNFLGQHIHFEVRKDETAIDPMSIID